MKFNAILVLLLLLVVPFLGSDLSGQTMEVQLDEIKITGSRKSAYSSGLNTLRIDSVIQVKYPGSDLSQILTRETNLNITQYAGQGSLSSIRLRGSAPSQTQINWNGIPVNSPTTGSIDLSLLSGGMADAIEIAYGASGSLFGSGTFGGSVNLTNLPDWENRFSGNLAAEAGSWQHGKVAASLRAGTRSFQYHVSGLSQRSPNTYPYNNVFKQGNPLEYRKNDSLTMNVLQQYIFLRLPGDWFMQYGIWWHQRYKLLPASMSSSPSYVSAQGDRSVKQFVRMSKWFNRSVLEMGAAVFSDSLDYHEKIPATDSLLKQSGIRSVSYYLSISYRWFLTRKLTLESGGETELQTARSGSLSGDAKENRSAAFALLRYTNHPFSASVSYRQVFFSMARPKPLFSLTAQYSLPVTGLILKGQISSKFRYPTLNDRYWTPGGNPALLPESGIGYDLGAEWSGRETGNLSVTSTAMLFVQHIDNWIQWVPVGTYWSPENVRKVRCQGLETDLSIRWKLATNSLIFKSMYSYAESLDMSTPEPENRLKRQLSYVPLHSVRLTGGYSFGKLESSLGYRFTSRRHTTDNHDPWLDLDPFHVIDLNISYTFHFKDDRLVLNGSVQNLANVQYQLIRAYPAPGRSFYLTVNYLFNRKSIKKDV